MRPIVLPFATSELPPVGGRIGGAPEDFRVDELPLYAASGAGEHLYVRVEKRALTTPALIGAVARAAGVRERDVGYAGLKDKHAVTSQWLSLAGRIPDPGTWSLPPGVRILETTRHGNKLRTGHLAGNRFRIRLVDVPRDGAGHAGALLAALAATGLPNAFGAQRFGHDGTNLVRALDWIRAAAPGARPPARFLGRLLASSLQAEWFNRYLVRRIARGVSRLVAGEIVRLAGTGSYFRVDDAEAEQARLAAGDLVLTGPLPGPRRRPAPGGDAAALEGEIQRELGLDADALARLGDEAPGAWRDLLVRPEAIECIGPADAATEGTLEIAFSLPAGSYATVLIRELTRVDGDRDVG
ncbi:MAG: tRNA pseudouridine(13) synthase TruD [Polyangiaceae bacterium]|nr:tRNA pseudouridine(13) synthase TruD [Polyangiaceae bacterium]